MTPPLNSSLRVVDSHTAGEPTRVVIAGAPLPPEADMTQLAAALRQDADWVRASLTLEPRGAPWMVGAVLAPSIRADCVAGVVFFNNAGYLGMCGHGLIGVVTTLAQLGKVEPGELNLETPVGVVTATLHEDKSVSFENVLSYRLASSVAVDVPGLGVVHGDIAYGGNWFFLTSVPQLQPERIPQYMERTLLIKQALADQGLKGDQGAEIDHVELFSPPSAHGAADAKNFVLCPGGEYDRSPCGTGTSAKVACLAADKKLGPGEQWIQESILGGCFEATYREADGGVIPTIRGRAFVTAETTILFDREDPLAGGLSTFPPRASAGGTVDV